MRGALTYRGAAAVRLEVPVAEDDVADADKRGTRRRGAGAGRVGEDGRRDGGRGDVRDEEGEGNEAAALGHGTKRDEKSE